MFKATTDGKHLVELSLKQRTQFVQYRRDSQESSTKDIKMPLPAKVVVMPPKPPSP